MEEQFNENGNMLVSLLSGYEQRLAHSDKSGNNFQTILDLLVLYKDIVNEQIEERTKDVENVTKCLVKYFKKLGIDMPMKVTKLELESYTSYGKDSLSCLEGKVISSKDEYKIRLFNEEEFEALRLRKWDNTKMIAGYFNAPDEIFVLNNKNKVNRLFCINHELLHALSDKIYDPEGLSKNGYAYSDARLYLKNNLDGKFELFNEGITEFLSTNAIFNSEKTIFSGINVMYRQTSYYPMVSLINSILDDLRKKTGRSRYKLNKDLARDYLFDEDNILPMIKKYYGEKNYDRLANLRNNIKTDEDLIKKEEVESLAKSMCLNI
jgi:hypothetical protein